MLNRLLKIDAQAHESFFLWGPRQAGKSTLLSSLYPDAMVIDLLEADTFLHYGTSPHALRQELQARQTRPARIIIDEIQKVPALLDEVHHLIEKERQAFALCGSSARKLRRGHANMLGGRALRFELTGLSGAECGSAWDLTRMLNTGYLPRHYLNPDRAPSYLRSYISDYLTQEIAAEGLVRNLPTFANFLQIAGLSDGEQLNYSTIARDVGVSSPTVKDYFSILSDTLIGYELPAFTRRPKRRIRQAPKFYFDDVGVVNHLAKRTNLEPRQANFGKAFENWVFHELHAYNRYSDKWYDLAYWRLANGTEVDFIVGDMLLAVEAKATALIHGDHLRGLRQLKIDHSEVKTACIVCLTATPSITDDGILILPYREFLSRLWSDQLFA